MVFPRNNQGANYQVVPNSSTNPTCPVMNVLKPSIPQTSSSSIIEQQNVAFWTVTAG